jgi:glutamate--cysteine ligase
LDAAYDLCKNWDTETREQWRVAASVDGLQAKVGGQSMHDIARECINIAELGLKNRAMPGAGGMVPDETHFLNALKDSVETGKTPADELLEQYHGAWGGDLSKIYGEFSY